MSFGSDWAYRGNLFPAYVLADDEYEYAYKIRISAFDQRVEPTLEQWQQWSTCDGLCGSAQTRTRNRIRSPI